ncbi:DUF2972 domain-containing protein [Campylobacter sp.]|uniref:DUF2972 domain-containing protein n=1 Tax=Campylobacter sp. TaxID=205 RepID=UPI0026DC628E|nr:DUF2972 domain-containing protein [Campylobacter sp.]MDO4674221.1 DUF2972 domain-containing protein [Campylobacter sp.]
MDQDLASLFSIHPTFEEIFKKHPSFVEENLSTIKNWLSSEEFKKKYRFHPYPPLLPPQSVDYTKFSGELVLDLNLPLPQNYDFILLFASSVGCDAMQLYLRDCGICINPLESIMHIKDYIDGLMELLLTPSSAPKCLFVSTRCDGDFGKILHLIDKKVPCFFVVRDFVSILKSSLNHIDTVASKASYRTRNLNLDTQAYFEQPKFLFHHITDLEELLDESNVKFLFQIASRLEILKPNKTIAIDFKMLQTRAYELFYELGFMPTNKALFASKINSYHLHFLPAVLHANGIEIHILHIKHFAFQTELIDVSAEFLDEIVFKELILAMRKEDFKNLDKAICKKIKKYFKQYIKGLQAKISQHNNFTEKDIVQFLHHAPKLKERFLEIMAKDALYLQQNHNEIFSQFIYYQALNSSKTP